MSTIIRELTDIQGVEVSTPSENPFSVSGMEVFASDAAYEIAQPGPVAGEFYFNSTDGAVRIYNGTAWEYDRTRFSTQTDAASTGADVDFSPNTVDQLVKFTNASLSSIRTINPANQRFLIVINGTAGTLTIKNESAGGTAANRIITGTGVDLSVRSGSSIILAYDTNSTRWRVTGGSGSGGSSTSPTNCCQSPNDVSIQWTSALQYGWFSSAATAATTTTTAAECPLAPILNTAIKITRTTVGSYEEYRWKIPAGLKNNTIPISWPQIVQAGMVSGEFKVDVYVYTDINYTDGTKVRKTLRSDSSSVSSIPAYSGFFGANNAYSFDTNATDDFYGMRITRVSGTNWISIVGVKIGFDEVGVTSAQGEYESVNTYTIGASTTPPTPGTGATFYRNIFRMGRFAFIRYEFKQGVAGSAGSGDYLLPLPSELQIDYTRNGSLGVTGTLGSCGFGNFRVNSGYFDASPTVLNTGAYVNKIIVNYTNDTTPETTWGSGGSLANGIVELGITVRVPIVGWDDAVIVGPATNIEYAYPTGTVDADTATDGTGVVLTSAGLTMSGLTTERYKYVKWNRPPQNGDVLEPQISTDTGRTFSSNAFGYVANASLTATAGVRYANTSAAGVSRFDIGRYVEGTAAWSSSYILRFKKVSAVMAPAGLEHGQFHGGAQLYRAGFNAGVNTGVAMTAGYIGEVLATSVSSYIPVISGAARSSASRALTAGVWIVKGFAFWSKGSGTANTYAIAALNSSADNVGSGTHYVGYVQLEVTDTGAAGIVCADLIVVTTGTTIHLNVQQDYSALGTGAWTGIKINAVRIA